MFSGRGLLSNLGAAIPLCKRMALSQDTDLHREFGSRVPAWQSRRAYHVERDAGRRRVVDTNVDRDLLKGFGLVPKSPLGN